jgi:arylsulfatase A-like enzyme
MRVFKFFPVSVELRHGRLEIFLFCQLAALFVAAFPAVKCRAAAVDRPNVVMIFADDLGYGDLGCFGAKGNPTPHLDRMAAEGVRLTDFHVAQPVCSASRAALLTGCYPNRIGILGALNSKATTGISDREMTLGDLLKSRGYATAIYGKWHLGHHDQFLPARHGFDDYFGLPYSNDMWPKHPTDHSHPPLPLIEGTRTIEHNPDQRRLTTWYTEHAVKFIERNKDRPFFVYVPHSMPHVPLHVSETFAGKSGRGMYGDVIAEVDGSVGQILAAIARNRLDDRTLVIFTSDNGPWLSYGDHAGSAGPWREGKATTFEGGHREPFIARWPSRIPPGTICKEPVMSIDLFPTIARIAGAALPDHPIDGKDIWPLLAGEPGAKSPHDALYFYWHRELQAVRSGRWKLHFPHDYEALVHAGRDGRPGRYETRHIGQSLFDLEADPGETTDVSAQHPDIVERLEKLAAGARDELGDSRTGQQGRGVRAAGSLTSGPVDN